ncbi:MAG: universal stress protein [Aurantimonas coralicida]|jgi:nucleotide-binding universal stress UspA family protein|uniref:universal stress protein n=1 Tax=Aurantimonas TaxID=182269 RepID=UPI000C405BA3|nr:MULTISPECIES: universal stress protein [Aurantimonas]MAY28670.1 universal stress protein UspA [Aurantimonas sp.]MCW7546012.1 universal stress protein [Aurantimonas litoralis]MBC6717558.1 universal stress protein [Aurantimonas sp. DM33-3]MCC4299097.1 universal stress protein [Aurantimonas coralicida]MCD1642153.1 universal stress protein [Aurantimonas coralicida]|tara:strand:+ start:433 stop:876 length:444 start_codon:yes stop_codon:yes gene_type:complete
MYKTVLVPVDGSPMATRALDVASEMCRLFGARLITLCVYRHHSPLEASLSMVRVKQPAERPDDSLKTYASEIAAAAKARALDSGVEEVTAYAKRGQPSRAIVAFAKQHDCDLIVLGARGNGDIEGFLLGSVSHKVASLAPQHCLIVR